jgi:hypothetical protein
MDAALAVDDAARLSARRVLFGLLPGALDQHLGRGGEGVELIGEPIHA